MERIHVSARLSIKEGKLTAFRSVASELIRLVRENEAGTLQYLWYMSEDDRTCVVREVYRDSESILAHMQSVGHLVPAFLDTTDLSLEIFGSPSVEVRETLAGLDPTYYGFLDGDDKLG